VTIACVGAVEDGAAEGVAVEGAPSTAGDTGWDEVDVVGSGEGAAGGERGEGWPDGGDRAKAGQASRGAGHAHARRSPVSTDPSTQSP
jgi:hypothetical protein